LCLTNSERDHQIIIAAIVSDTYKPISKNRNTGSFENLEDNVSQRMLETIVALILKWHI